MLLNLTAINHGKPRQMISWQIRGIKRKEKSDKWKKRNKSIAITESEFQISQVGSKEG